MRRARQLPVLPVLPSPWAALRIDSTLRAGTSACLLLLGISLGFASLVFGPAPAAVAQTIVGCVSFDVTTSRLGGETLVCTEPTDEYCLYGCAPGEGTFQDLGNNPDRQGWTGVDCATDPSCAPLVGDFSKVFAFVSDTDPFHDNSTGVIGFVDDGTAPGTGACPPGSTGGSTFTGYGVSGGWTVNSTGGLSSGTAGLNNHVWSPPITWAGGSGGVDMAGAYIEFDLWRHLPLEAGMFFVWMVRSTLDGTTWSAWQSRDEVYYGGDQGRWETHRYDVSDLLLTNPLQVQISLGVVDLKSHFNLGAATAFPSPTLDNVKLVKYRLDGPVIASRSYERFQDGFPVSGAIDASTQASRDALDVPLDAARDTGAGPALSRLEGAVARIKAVIPGTALTDMRMHWVLDVNPLFEGAVRSIPQRLGLDVNVTTGPDRWFGEVLPQPDPLGRADHFLFDLPDVDLLYPGDVLRYYFAAEDSDGRQVTCPRDLTGFEFGDSLGVPYDSRFVVRALPSLENNLNEQPPVLFVNLNGSGDQDTAYALAFASASMTPGTDYDTYVVQAPSTNQSNGLGAAGFGGAVPEQLFGYSVLLFTGGERRHFLLSDGSGGLMQGKQDDLQILTDWKTLTGDRGVVTFASHLASSLNRFAAGATYLADEMKVDVLGEWAQSVLSPPSAGQNVGPTFGPPFVDPFSVGTGTWLHSLDQIERVAPAVQGHGFANNPSIPADPPDASVIHERTVGSDRHVDISFPYDLVPIIDEAIDFARAPVDLSARARLLAEVLDYLGVSPSGQAVSAPSGNRGPGALASARVRPNPFNPRVEIEVTVHSPVIATVRVFDPRGRVVRTLLAGEPIDTSRSLVWDGRDTGGAEAASGVYFVKVSADEEQIVTKVTLVR